MTLNKELIQFFFFNYDTERVFSALFFVFVFVCLFFVCLLLLFGTQVVVNTAFLYLIRANGTE